MASFSVPRRGLRALQLVGMLAISAAAPSAALDDALAVAPQLAPTHTVSTRAEPAAPDPATLAGRSITRLVKGFPSLRSEIARATWRNDEHARWQVRTSTRCLAQVEALRVPTRPLDRALSTPVPAPVVITGAIGGVVFRPVQKDRQLEVSCELAARLPALAKILRAHGVRAVHVNSTYRDQPRVSFHTFGLALDMASFETKDGPLVVATDFEMTPDVETCQATPTSERGRALLSLACDLAASGLFSSVLTPNYNAGHRDHFHLDIRPNDARLFVR